MKQKEVLKQKAEDEGKRKEAELEAENLTFKPVINEYSRLLSPRYFEKTEDVLLRKADAYKEKKEQLKSKYEHESMKECSFVPKILNTSHNISKDSSVHDSLYFEAEKRQKRRDVVSEVSFKLNHASKPSLDRSRASAANQEEYADRLINYKKNFEEKMEREREAQLMNELSRDGKPMFTPNIGKSPPKRDGNVFENLYARKDDKKERISKEYENILQKHS